MSDRYYSFLSDRLIDWLKQRKNLQSADKYFVLLDSEADALNFYNAIENASFSGKNKFVSKEFNYQTIGVKKDGINVLFVSPVNRVTQDFLVTVRNRVNTNEGDWKNTAVIFIVYDALDSIIGGSFDISQKDAPFNIKTIKENVKKEIDNTQKLKESEKEALEYYMREIAMSSNSNLKDFEIIFGILNQGEIRLEDYNLMGFFPDKGLDSLPKKALESRIEENHSAFQKFEMLHNFIDVKDRIGKELIDDSLINELSKEDTWKKVDFSEVEKGMQDARNQKKVHLEYSPDNEKESDDKWFRVSGKTASKRKKAHIILSSKNNNLTEYSFEVIFDDKVLKSNIIATNTFTFEGQGKAHNNVQIIARNNKFVLKINDFNNLETYGGQLVYRHNGANNLTFKVTYMIVPFELEDIKSLRPNFEIGVFKSGKKFYFGISSDAHNYDFGQNINDTLELDNLDLVQHTDVYNKRIVLSENIQEDDKGKLRADLILNGLDFPVSFLDIIEKPKPALPMTIERQRLGTKDSQFEFNDGKIYTGSSVISIEKNYKQRLQIEQEILETKSLYGEIIGNSYVDINIKLPNNIVEAYEKLISYYIQENTVPSLAIPSNEHIYYLKLVIEEITKTLTEELVDGNSMQDKLRNISKIGQIKVKNGIEINPLNPLLIAYQLQLSSKVSEGEEIPRENVLSTLNAQYLLPYFRINDDQYQASYTRHIPRWLSYNVMTERKITNFGSQIISKRLDDYITQYEFLFRNSKETALNIAVISITDEAHFFDAVITFMINRSKEVELIEEINPLNIYFDQIGNQTNSLFGKLYEINSIEKLNEMLVSKQNDFKFEDYEILEMLQDKINVYKLPSNTKFEELNLYFHITFYQFIQQKGINKARMENLNKNYSLHGLLNGPQYHKEVNSYSNGFGMGRIEHNNESDLINFTVIWNSFIAAMNKETDIYREGDTLVNNIPQLNYDQLQPMIDNSSWVTLLNLDVDLSYFFDERNSELLVIHYSDQSTTNQYESVTVTNDLIQYERLLKETFFDKLSDRTDFDTKEIIKYFNVINGQWLLQLISNAKKKIGNRNILREKLSIISAYKELLGILEHPNFYWIPVSLEEILRVSGMVGLSQKDGLFSSKNLGTEGSTSDDLLLMGIEVTDGKPKIHFLPVEVKVGQNNTTVTNKAFNQVSKTHEILKKFLGEENQNIFMRDYYRNFFISIMTANLDKAISSGIYSYKIIHNLDNLKDRLSVGDYTLSMDLEAIYGKGIVFQFTSNQSYRKANLVNARDVMLIEVPETDAYNIVTDKLENIIKQIQEQAFDFRQDLLLSNVYESTSVVNNSIEQEYIEPTISPLPVREGESTQKDSNVLEISTTEYEYEEEVALISEEDDSFVVDQKENSFRPINEEPIMEEKENEEIPLASSSVVNVDTSNTKTTSNVFGDVSLQNKRILIGEVKNSTHKIYWEYGNKQLANRHLFITGKSGQGKTYFVQTLLAELSNVNINSLVVDYTDGFLQNQLDDLFTQQYDDKIVHRFIMKDKLPINPFKIQEIDLGGFVIPESEQDMADRVVQVIDFVFDLGIQQKTLLSETIIQGHRTNGESYRFAHLADELRYSDDKAAQNLYGRISSLLSRDPFSYEDNFDWSDIFGTEGKIHIFQMKGYQLNIQKVLIEFLLWDVYQYSTRRGNEGKPMPIILDEVQNLNFGSSSPAVKVLREGRKFGLSGIFATQSLDSIKGNDTEAIFNAAQQMHFLPPDSQLTTIAKRLSSGSDDRSNIERELKNLHKGEAIVYGPTLKQSGFLSVPHVSGVRVTSFQNRN